MKLLPGLAVIAAALALTAEAGAAALPFGDAYLLPNQQIKPVDVALDGSKAAVILPGGAPRVYEKNGSGIWIRDSDFPAGALSISIRDGAPPVAATGYTGRIEVRSYDSGEDAWFIDETIPLAAGEQASRLVLQDGILAAVVGGGTIDDEQEVRIFQNAAGHWSLVKAIEVVPPPGSEIIIAGSAVSSIDLHGTRLAIGSMGLGEVWIHEQNSGGANNWGRVVIVPRPSGQKRFGSAVALENDRLAVVGVDTASNRPDVIAFGRNTGGPDAWGKIGTILSNAGASETSPVTMDMADSRLAVLSSPGFGDILAGLGGGHAWYFATGASPSGWVEEAQTDFGQITLPIEPRPIVALDGSECLVGLGDEEYLDSNGASWAVCVQRRGTGDWNRAQLIEGPGLPERLGKVIAMRGDYLVAGMPGDDGTGIDSGAVMVWRVLSLPTNGDRWFPLARIESPTPVAGDRFGASVAIGAGGEDRNEYWIAVGAPGVNSGRGAVYLFNLSSSSSLGGAPTMIVRTPAAGLSADDQFGASVALSGTTDIPGPLILAAGAPGKNGADTDSGVVYLFKQDTGGADAWGEWKTISRPLIPGGKFFGDRVALAGDGGLAVGQRPVGGVPGKVYLFSRYEGGTDNWGMTDRIEAPVAAPPRFAETLSASRNGLLVGAPGGSSGRAYYYGNSITPSATFGDASSGPEFGAAVSISDDASLIIGDPGVNAGAGRISAWELTSLFPTITWTPLFQQDGAFDSAFGSAVASSKIYHAGGAPSSDAAGTDYGAIEVYRAGSYEKWAAAQGTGFTDWHPDMDADHDGQSNLIEFALGSNPRVGTLGIFTMNRTTYPSGPEPYPAMRFVRPSLPYSKSALLYRMERSENLTSWLNARYDVLLDDPLARYYSATAARGFFRLNPKYPDFTPELEGGLVVPGE